MQASSNQTSDMGHVYHKERAYIIGDGSHFFKINDTRICAGSSHNQARAVLESCLAHFIIIDQERIFLHAVSDEVIKQAGGVDRASVRQVSAMCQIHAQYRITWIQHSQINGQVRLSAGVRLNVGMLRSEQFLSTVARDILYDIHVFTAAVKTFARVSFCIFVREHGAHRFHNRFTNNVLGSNQLNVVPLALQLQIHRFQYCRVLFSQMIHRPKVLPIFKIIM
ncbi:hypothetical protein D3C77_487550 [compost metagenome]